MSEPSETVLPCPFCGSSAQAIAKLNSVVCSNLHCRAAIRWVPEEPIEAAIEAWNTRPIVGDEQLLREALEEAQGTLRMMQAHCEMNDVATPRIMEELEVALAKIAAALARRPLVEGE
jgi:hypothetical protein